MNYHDWIKKYSVDAVKNAGDKTFFFERGGTDLGLLGVLFDGQLKKGPWCDRLGHSPCFTDVCKAIYESLATSDKNLQGMGEIQQILIGVALIAGRRPSKNKQGKVSYDTSGGQAFDSLPFSSLYQAAFESGFNVGLLADDMLTVMNACKKDNSKWRFWFQNKCQTETVNEEGACKYLPTKEDVVIAESNLQEYSGIEAVLDQIEIDFKKSGKPLKGNWREITKQNIKIWFSNIAGGTDAA